jgi:hypothetical protein
MYPVTITLATRNIASVCRRLIVLEPYILASRHCLALAGPTQAAAAIIVVTNTDAKGDNFPRQRTTGVIFESVISRTEQHALSAPLFLRVKATEIPMFVKGDAKPSIGGHLSRSVYCQIAKLCLKEPTMPLMLDKRGQCSWSRDTTFTELLFWTSVNKLNMLSMFALE